MCTKKIREYLKKHTNSQKGQGMVEYALILAFVVAVALALVGTDGIQQAIQTTFGNVSTTLNDANNQGGGGQGGT